MDENSQLRALLDVAPHHEYDEIFNRLAHGELSAHEAEALRTNPDPEIRRLYELFLPFDAATHRRFEQAVAQVFAKESAPAVAKAPLSASPPRRLRLVARRMLPFAAAAAVAIVFMHLHQAPTAKLSFHPLDPPQQYSQSGGTLLGGNDNVQEMKTLRTGTCWPLQLSVGKKERLPKVTRAFFIQGERAVPWQVTFVPKPNDRLGMAEGCAQIRLSPGQWDLAVLSGERVPELGPKAIVAACKKGASPSASWRCDRYPINILPAVKESL